ncbi:MAG: hypothetical protein ACE5HX_00770 [bacterium]
MGLGTVTGGAFQAQSGENFKIAEIKMTQAPSLNPAVIIRKGEDFKLTVKFEFTEILGDLHAQYVFDMFAHNIATGGVEATYNIHKEDTLPTAPPNSIVVSFDIKNVQALGIFKYNSVVTLPDSDIAAFIEGPVFAVIP